MSDENQKFKIMFAPGTLEMLEQEMDPEDLQKFMDDLKQAVEDGSLLEQSTAIDMDSLETEDPELYAILQQRQNDVEDMIASEKLALIAQQDPTLIQELVDNEIRSHEELVAHPELYERFMAVDMSNIFGEQLQQRTLH